MTRAAGVVLRHIRRLVQGDGPDRGADCELLRRYTADGDEAAFATLVHRHGPMVWGVCRRALRHHQDAEDVFQATFLVLARKAAAIRWRTSIAPWLYTVAQRLALKARAEAARRPVTADVEPAAPDPFEAMTARDLLAAVDEEVAALPARDRGPVVLCWLEGRTQEEAARLLGTSLSTVRRRLDVGKRRLRARLARRGLTPAVALAVPALASAVPASALAGAMGGTAATARAAALAEGLPFAVAGKPWTVLMILALCVATVGVVLAVSAPSPEPQPGAAQQAPPREADDPPSHTDALGDPLPPGVLLRLGSIRLRHSATFSSVAFSPDGSLLASGGQDPVIRLWDPQTGKELRQILGPPRGVGAVAFSPDGKHLAGGGADGAVHFFDVATGKEVRRLKGVPTDLRVLAFSPKGDLVVAGDKASFRAWDAVSGKVLWTFDRQGENTPVVAFAPDGRAVAAAWGDQPVRLLEAATGKVIRELGKHTGYLQGLVFSPDGKALLTVGFEETAAWDPTTGKKVEALDRVKGRGRCAAFSPDGKLLAVGGNDSHTRLWDWASRKEVLRLRKHPDNTRCLAFSPDGRTLATVADAVAIHLWDVATGRPKLALPGHEERLTSVACSPDGRSIITAAWDGTVRLWDAQTGKEQRRLDVGQDKERNFVNPAARNHLVLSPDGKLLAAVRGDEVALIWDVATGKEVRRYRATCVAFSPDGKLIACGGRGTMIQDANAGIIRLYDRATGKEVRELRGHRTVLGALAFTPDGKTLHSRGLVHFGSRFGDAGEDETKHVRAWDVATGKERRPLPGGERPNGVILAPDGRTAATFAMMGKTVNLWEALTGGRRGELKGHKDMVFDVAFSPDGRTLASASMDGSVRLWDLASGKEVGRLEGHRSWVVAVAFSPDGTRLVSGSLDTTALVWDVARFTRRPATLRELTAAELESCWEDLRGDAAVGHLAVGRLVASPKQAVSLLAERLKPAPPADAARIAQLIADLGSAQFKARDLAGKELEKLGQVAAPAVRRALDVKPALEVRRRLEGLLEKLEDASLPRDEVRRLRAIEALEHIATPESRGQLEALIRAGAPEGRLTREATAALRRLQRGG